MSLITIDVQVQDVRARMDAYIHRIQQALTATVREVGDGALRDFKATTRTWQNKPTFETMQDIGVDKATLILGTDDTVYRYVDEGTRPHFIFPRRPGGVLAFKWGGPGSYSSKTRPDWIGSQGSRQTGEMTYRRHVLHPGFEGRRFTKAIYEKWNQKTPEILDRQIKRALR